jgi:hypothetical protein
VSLPALLDMRMPLDATRVGKDLGLPCGVTRYLPSSPFIYVLPIDFQTTVITWSPLGGSIARPDSESLSEIPRCKAKIELSGRARVRLVVCKTGGSSHVDN